MSKETPTKGVILLTASTVIVKFAGLLFKIPLTALLGESGMGYFNSAYTLFTWFYMVSTAGLPVAAAMMISDARAHGNTAQIKRVRNVSIVLFAILGIVGCGMMTVGAGFFASLMRVEKSKLSMLAIAPTLIFICQSAALRGYFQGMGELVPHALSQLAEAAGKLFLGIGLAKYALGRGFSTEKAAAFAALGLTIGVGAGMLVLYLSTFFVRLHKSPIESDSRTRILKNLVKVAIPITLSAGLSSLAGLSDGILMTRRLHDAGFSQNDAAAIWGNYSSLALPMFNLPPVLIYPLAYALMPELTSLLAAKKVSAAVERCRRAFSLTAAIAIPCAVGLCSLSEPILALFFDGGMAKRGAGMLTLLAPSSFLVCLFALTNTILQSSKHVRDTLWAMAAGVAVKLVSAWFLIPTIGKSGTPISTFLCYFTAVAISIARIESAGLGGALKLGDCVFWFFGAGAAVTAAILCVNPFGIVVAICAAGGIYALLCGSKMLKIVAEK